MAFTIIVFEKDLYLKRLIECRLSLSFPDAYISGQKERVESGLSECTIRLYDDRQFNEDEVGNKAIPLFTEGCIDCRKLEDQILDILDTRERVSDPSMCLLISFAYMDEREDHIRREYSSFKECHDVCIRLDLMSGIRMPSPFTTGLSTGSLTRLLRKCTDPGFDPEEIMDHLNHDSNGFMTAGKPDNPDDVFDLGIDASAVLIKSVRELIERGTVDISCLVVTEGFTVKDLTRISGLFDRVEILLPSRLCEEKNNIEEVLGSLSRNIPEGTYIKVRYCDETTEDNRVDNHRVQHQ